jgi:hypothetical protein
VTEVHGKAGDAIIFSETCTHGTLPWTAAHQRRAILYKYSPGHLAYAGGSFAEPGPHPEVSPHSLVCSCHHSGLSVALAVVCGAQ